MEECTFYITLTATNFDEEVFKSPHPILVKIGADWSGSCQIMMPMLEQLASKFKGLVRFGRVNIEENEQLVKALGIHEMPILLFIKNGQIVDHIIGTVPKPVIEEKINTMLKVN